MANYTKLMIVRHPFTRLLSAYWDKMSVHDVDPVYRLARESVVMAMKPKTHRRKIRTTRPTFQDFVTMMLKAKWKYARDRHWRSYYDLCSPCAIRYDHILKLEALSQEIEPILQILAHRNKTVQHLRSLVVPKNKSDDFKKSSKRKELDKSILTEYFNLTVQQREQLYKRYENDLKLYGYTFDIETAKAGFSTD